MRSIYLWRISLEWATMTKRHKEGSVFPSGDLAQSWNIKQGEKSKHFTLIADSLEDIISGA